MTRLTVSAAAVVFVAMSAATGASSQAPAAGPAFDVVSVKRNTASTSPSAPPDVRFNSTVRRVRMADSRARGATGRLVVDKTGLSGSYRLTLKFDRMAALRGPQTDAQAPDPGASVFTAVQEQLGLKLESSRAMRETLIIDRFERPTEN